MSLNTPTLPNISTDIYLTDGGLETTLIFLQGYELPCFAAFDLLKDAEGYEALKNYYRQYLQLGKQYKTGFILESPTWRANPDWIEKTGYPPAAIKEVNEKAIDLLIELKSEFDGDIPAILLSGCIGPRGDGYKPDNKMTVQEAKEYHGAQINVFGNTPVDMVSAITMNYAEEAAGIALAAQEAGKPSVISFTVETNGKLATGMSLHEAIEFVDSHVQQLPLYYMINCAHPNHFTSELWAGKNEPWTKRIRGIRANASCKSHAELDESTTLDRGEPAVLGEEHRKLKETFPHLNIFGGCCGTDEEHVMAIAGQVTTV